MMNLDLESDTQTRYIYIPLSRAVACLSAKPRWWNENLLFYSISLRSCLFFFPVPTRHQLIRFFRAPDSFVFRGRARVNEQSTVLQIYASVNLLASSLRYRELKGTINTFREEQWGSLVEGCQILWNASWRPELCPHFCHFHSQVVMRQWVFSLFFRGRWIEFTS